MLLFIGLPIVELALLLKVTEYLDLGGTLALVIVTGFVGVSLARWQGLNVLTKLRAELRQGRMPAPDLVDGFLILIAGALLVTPGLITDSVGFFLLIPPGRAALKRWVRRALERKMRQGVVDVTYWEW
jgi:UPF0716 protein FxsA